MKKSVFKTKNDAIFYGSIVFLPLLQFFIFYIIVNFNSILMAFQKYSISESGVGLYEFAGFNNFIMIFTEEFSSLISYAKNSMILLFFNMLLGIPFALMFSYYIYKKKVLSGLFKVILYLPNIISIAVIALIYIQFTNFAIPDLYESVFGVAWVGDRPFDVNVSFSVIFFTVFFSFGTGVLLYVGAMGKISDSIIEAASIDGASSVKEFFYIILPLVYPTISTFVITGLAAMFVNQANLFTFQSEGVKPQNRNIGYYLFVEAKKATGAGDYSSYPFLSALGLVCTLITIGVTMLVKRILDKYDPTR